MNDNEEYRLVISLQKVAVDKYNAYETLEVLEESSFSSYPELPAMELMYDQVWNYIVYGYPDPEQEQDND